ncbi:MAG: 1-(5-phosphoribosyl)-5-((5-phosphoribosylamino)methylideneamino)imidazole-4-carboxamide isomerase [Ignavibacteria bacterium CG22_combo_CG10-13_8_21_14_all_37_15]|nr:MAG: 1-(5-phosphoribosyl)-5-((5-phosphoribosylamino)methylideneamino)imidazole-4-carboxamide isomerase [Ignavibacteria bacterium CG22_combo_CG10-13_8_21_14_all_37_15]
MAFLLVIPSIDIKNGKTVRIVQGIPELHCNEYGSDPVEMAKIWRAENSKMLHIVDFDALHGDKNKNVSLLEEICNSVIIPVEFAGGIRTLEDANKYFNLGVSRIAISTLALENLPEFKKIFDTFGPKKIVVSLDVIDNEIVIKGRKIKTGILPIAFALKLREIGVERFIVTDVKKNGMMLGPNIELSRAIADATQAKVTLSGGIRNKDELMDVQALLSVGVDSVIVGRALYENRFPCQKLWRVAELGIFN